MKIRWDVDDNTVVAAKIGSFGGGSLTVNERDIPCDAGLRKKGDFPFQLPDGRQGAISVTPRFGTQPLVELRVDGKLMIPTEKKPVLCGECGKPVKPNDQFCGACGHEMPPAEHYVHKRHVKEATGAITLLAVLFAIFAPLMYYLTKLQTEPLLAKLGGMDPDETYPQLINGAQYTVAELQAELAWEPWSVLIVNLILAVIMAVLALWGRRAPLAAVLVASATYAVLIVANAIIDPSTLAQGIIVKVIIIAALARGLKAALALRTANG